METAREFYRRRSIELAKTDFNKKLAKIVNIDKEVQIMEEYGLKIKATSNLIKYDEVQ